MPLLAIIRLTEDIVSEVQKRGCGPLETYIFTLRLKMWPVFQKLMAEHVDALKKFAEGASAGYFRRSGTSDAAVSSVSTLPAHVNRRQAFERYMSLARFLFDITFADRILHLGLPSLRHHLQFIRRPHRSTRGDDDLLEVRDMSPVGRDRS